jgi:prepilin-type N-terminal cleavage/methylation domain-containing protein
MERMPPVTTHDRNVARTPRERGLGGQESRCGFSLLELTVALTLFGIALTGVFPLVVMQSRAMASLERRGPVVGRWYLAPSVDPWARKLGAGASLTNQDPGPKPAPPVLVGDDGDEGYTQTAAAWVVKADTKSRAFQLDSRRHPPIPVGTTPSEADHATWTFTGVTPGWYQIQATWAEATDQTDDARYTLYDGETLLGDASANQRLAPAGVLYEGRPWQILATKYVCSSAVRVQLGGQSTAGYVVADGVRLVPVENNVQVLSLEKSLTSEEATVCVSIELLVPH